VGARPRWKGGRGTAACRVGLVVPPRLDVSAALRPDDWMGQVSVSMPWTLGILICAGARSTATARVLSPSPGPSRPGPDRDPKPNGPKAGAKKKGKGGRR
jgi:hypothetical protein